MQTLLL